MDLHIIGGEPTDDERAAVDALFGPPESGWQGGERDIARDGRTATGGRSLIGDRHQLLPAFHSVQDRVGWVSRGGAGGSEESASVHGEAKDPRRPRAAIALSDTFPPRSASSVARVAQ